MLNENRIQTTGATSQPCAPIWLSPQCHSLPTGWEVTPSLDCCRFPPCSRWCWRTSSPFLTSICCLTLPIPNDATELGPRLSQGITNWMLAFQGFLQQSWLCFCQRSQQCPGAKAVQAGLQSSCSHKVFVSHFSCLSRRKTNVGHYGWKQSPRTEVWG